MVTDSWSQVRGRVAAFFSRGGAAVDEETVEGELELSRGELAAAREAGDEQTVSDVEAEWRTRLRRALQADPELCGRTPRAARGVGAGRGRAGPWRRT
ncbi:hypothetical protein [Streptomyces sp. A5-4]|uniref:hypothetical protein n=1 Tax=Streptomyces sp. A5-4 TaxID=3384771 RepID=UPI003DA8ABA5